MQRTRGFFVFYADDFSCKPLPVTNAVGQHCLIGLRVKQGLLFEMNDAVSHRSVGASERVSSGIATEQAHEIRKAARAGRQYRAFRRAYKKEIAT